ncbi:MAG: EAL domain-containing protein [Spirulina sp. DLM2.Bin59]|nr:MAG: EAL domain-containing protein [Spirulina sp. DLM2.Bin59]
MTFVPTLADPPIIMDSPPSHCIRPGFSDELTLSTAEISHELRTPLTSIRGALGLLLSGKINVHTEQGQHLLHIAANNADRLIRLTTTIEDDQMAAQSLLTAAGLARLRLEKDLLQAWDSRDFAVYYQPIVSATTHAIQGFEALTRWQHPHRGFISPAEFIPIAEELHLIHDLGLWVFEQACQQLAHWQAQFPRTVPLTMSVNLSPLQLLRGNLAQQVTAIIAQYPVAPGSLRVEITESTVIENPIAIATLQALKASGIQVYLDDFGTGYSCLARLHDLAVDVLKIDRSFVVQQQWQMIRGIVQLAKSIGLTVITEGVETENDVERLTELGCHALQGYWFSKPVMAHQVEELLHHEIKVAA